MIGITLEMLTELRVSVGKRMSAKRYAHTLAVEDMVARLCALYTPDEELLMRAAALLHDITKECTKEEHLASLQSLGLEATKEELFAPKTLHARTAAALIPSRYPEFAHPTVIDAVRWHTTGHAGMTLTEKLLYLADYIDDSRTFPTCVLLRKTFWDATPEAMSPEERITLLDDVILLSLDMTVNDLIAEHKSVAVDTVEARNELLFARANP